MNKNLLKLGLPLLFVVVLAIVVGWGTSSSSTSLQGKQMTIYHSPTCKCCERYVSYLRDNGIEAESILKSRAELSMVKAEYDVPRKTQSCHTAVLDDYVIEGHVPIEAIETLVDQNPDLAGIGIPGMPRNTPGMGKSVGKTFTVRSFSEDGTVNEFTSVTY